MPSPGSPLPPDYTAVNERFNGTSWSTLAPIPVPHAQSRGTAVGTNIYVPGGFNSVSFGGPLDTMQIYNTTANTWSAGMTLPAARSGVATAAFNGLVYMIGGYNPTVPAILRFTSITRVRTATPPGCLCRRARATWQVCCSMAKSTW